MKHFTFLFLPVMLIAQFSFSGKIAPKYLIRISDGSEISLPFRLGELQLGYSIGNFEFKTNTALETRWQGTEVVIDLREAYLTWYPAFGEVKLGKMIHTWGVADGNNPTDNINPYDFYYMFLPGADRKIGILSGSLKTYWKNLIAELIVIPEHTPNRLPFGEEDFPIQFPFEPNEYVNIEKPVEFGIRMQSAFNWGDASISYLNGYDDGFSMLGVISIGMMPNPIIPQFGYRKTSMIGADFVSFVSDFTLRGEVGYFITDNNYEFGNNVMKINIDADYIQYVVQLEYAGFSDFNIGAQLIGTDKTNVEGDTFSPTGIVTLTKENFTPGMGTPFAIIAEKALVVNASTSIFDSRLDLEAMTLINLEDTGYLLGMNAGYSPIENWEVQFGLNKFIGDEDDPQNRFGQMEDFSHIYLGLEYNF